MYNYQPAARRLAHREVGLKESVPGKIANGVRGGGGGARRSKWVLLCEAAHRALVLRVDMHQCDGRKSSWPWPRRSTSSRFKVPSGVVGVVVAVGAADRARLTRFFDASSDCWRSIWSAKIQTSPSSATPGGVWPCARITSRICSSISTHALSRRPPMLGWKAEVTSWLQNGSGIDAYAFSKLAAVISPLASLASPLPLSFASPPAAASAAVGSRLRVAAGAAGGVAGADVSDAQAGSGLLHVNLSWLPRPTADPLLRFKLPYRVCRMPTYIDLVWQELDQYVNILSIPREMRLAILNIKT